MNPVPVPLPTRVFLACGVIDKRKGFDGLAVLVQQVLAQNPHSGALFAFRGSRPTNTSPRSGRQSQTGSSSTRSTRCRD
nr:MULTISPECIES: IS66 family insertion sequence element accessory protein TnpB [unclassified Sphingomonas]